VSPASDPPRYRRRSLLAAGAAALAGGAGCTALAGFGRRRHESDADLSGPAAAWSGKMGGPARRSRSAVDGALPDDATPRPAEGLTGAGSRRPVVGSDALFLVSEDLRRSGEDGPVERVIAVDRVNGFSRWEHRLTNANSYPTVLGNTVFAQGDSVVAVDRREGVLRWRVDAGYAWWQTAPTPAGDMLLVTAAEPGTVWGLDPRTGRRRWTADLPGLEPRALAATGGGGAAYLAAAGVDGGEERALLRLDPATGETVWRRPTIGEPATPVLGSDRLYLHGGDRLVVRRGADGSVAWSRSLTRAVPRGGLALGSERCFVVARGDDGRRRLYALRRADGSTDWTGPTVPPLESGAVSVAGDRVYVPLADDAGPALATLEAATGERARTVGLPGRPATGVAVGDGRGGLIVRDGTGGRLLILE
jgi:outer membrane protein assembly factor BamB